MYVFYYINGKAYSRQTVEADTHRYNDGVTIVNTNIIKEPSVIPRIGDIISFSYDYLNVENAAERKFQVKYVERIMTYKKQVNDIPFKLEVINGKSLPKPNEIVLQHINVYLEEVQLDYKSISSEIEL